MRSLVYHYITKSVFPYNSTHLLFYQSSTNFIEVFTDDKPDSSATIIQNSTNHVAALPTGHLGHIEVPITNEKPKNYQVNNINTLLHNVTHTYHPDITKLVPSTNYAIQPNNNTVPSHHFSLHQLFMTDPTPSLIPSSIYNVKPTSHTSKPRIFPSLLYTTENLHFINKFNFQFFEFSDTECVTYF